MRAILNGYLIVDEIETPRFPDEHKSKAYIHTWLAWQEEPGKPLGLAITFRYLDANAPTAQKLFEFLRRLFELALQEKVWRDSIKVA